MSAYHPHLKTRTVHPVPGCTPEAHRWPVDWMPAELIDPRPTPRGHAQSCECDTPFSCSCKDCWSAASLKMDPDCTKSCLPIERAGCDRNQGRGCTGNRRVHCSHTPE